MDISYFLENDSQGAAYISKAMNELKITVSDETTVVELFSIFNGIFARAIDILIEDMKEDKLF